MANHLQYSEILEGAEGLSVEDQETLMETLKHRLRERRRASWLEMFRRRKTNSAKAAARDPRPPN